MAVVTLINRSGWPEGFAKPVVRWVATLAGIKQPHTLVLVGTSDRLHLAGRYSSGRRYVRVRIHRRWLPKGGVRRNARRPLTGARPGLLARLLGRH